MNDLFLQSLCRRIGVPNLPERLVEHLSVSDISALLLEVFRRQADKTPPQSLLTTYRQNHLVQPSAVDAVSFREFELLWLKAGRNIGFTPQELSPVAPLGSCSAVGTVHQNKVLSALRGTEVVADITNVLALETCSRRRASGFPAAPLHYCAAHRHLRTQQINVPVFTPHFGAFCLVTAGRDTGSFHFEKENLALHIGFYVQVLTQVLDSPRLTIVLRALDPESGENRVFDAAVEHVKQHFSEMPIAVQRLLQTQQAYYQALQFGIAWEHGGSTYTIIDGGFTDWTQRITSNRKERFLGSGIGLEFVWKIMNNQIGEPSQPIPA